VTACVYCLGTRQLRDEQVLLRGDDLYLCAPRGQLVEGYLVVAPYRCVGCLAQLPPDCFPELARLLAAVTSFYARAYGIAHPLVYEQGRAGGGRTIDEERGFPLHAHLCSLPLAADLHVPLSAAYQARPLSGPHEIAAVAGREPYVYLDDGQRRAIYVARDPAGRRALEGLRLKPVIAALAGFPERGSWRAYPGDRELAATIEKWRRA